MSCELVDQVSHDFRTPLTVIKEYAAILCDGLAGPINDQQREFLQIINDRSDELAMMVDNLLDASRLEAGLLRAWRRRSTVSEILKPVCPTLERKAAVREVRLEITVEDDLPDVYCDARQIGRVILNLAAATINRCGADHAVRLLAWAENEASEVVFAVTDDGPGVNREDSERALDARVVTCSTVNSRTHPPDAAKSLQLSAVEDVIPDLHKGLRLGLSVAEELARLNLGAISAESGPGRGCTLSFGIPACNPSKLLARYLRQLQSTCNEATRVTLLVAEAAPQLEQDVSSALDELLQRAFGQSDLVVRLQPHKWLAVAECGEREVGELHDRVSTAWAEINQNRPDEELPKIDLQTKGTWTVEDQTKQLVRCWQQELPSVYVPQSLTV